MTNRLAMFLGLSLTVTVAQLRAQEGPRQPFEATVSQHVSFAAGGTVRIENSYGYLTVEGWDEPEVEISVTKSTDSFYKPDHMQQAVGRLDRVRVSTEPRSGKEFVISTNPARGKLLVVSWPFPRKRGVTAEYKIHVPRDSRLEIHHDNGYIWVSDVTGDIQIGSHTGDMIVALPVPGSYSIDAKTGMGSIYSDFVGKGNKLFLVGSHFGYTDQSQARQVRLRMGRGCISILNGPPSGPSWKN